MMAAPLHLEDFAGDATASAPATPAQRKPSQHDEGYAAGIAAAEEGFAQDQNALRAELIDALRAVTDDRDAIQSEIMAALTPLHDALLHVLLPEALAPALVAHLRDLLADARARDLAMPVTLCVPVGQAEMLRAAIADTQLHHITFQEDASLGPHAARISTVDQTTALDLDAALRAISDEMSALTTSTKTSIEVALHG